MTKEGDDDKASMQVPANLDVNSSSAGPIHVDPIELTVEPTDPKQHIFATAAIGPTRKRRKVKLEEFQPDFPPSSSVPDHILSVDSIPSSSAQPDPVTSGPDAVISGPIPDPTTSLSNAAVSASRVARDILQVNLRTGTIQNTHKTFAQAGKAVGCSRHIVASIVRGTYKTNHYEGWTFRYAADEKAPAAMSRGKHIEQIDVASGNVIATFQSNLAASKQTGVGRKVISSIVNGELESVNGWTFRLVEAVSQKSIKTESTDSNAEPSSSAHTNVDSINTNCDSKDDSDIAIASNESGTDNEPTTETENAGTSAQDVKTKRHARAKNSSKPPPNNKGKSISRKTESMDTNAESSSSAQTVAQASNTNHDSKIEIVSIISGIDNELTTKADNASTFVGDVETKSHARAKNASKPSPNEKEKFKLRKSVESKDASKSSSNSKVIEPKKSVVQGDVKTVDMVVELIEMDEPTDYETVETDDMMVELGYMDEPTDYERVEITVTEPGPLGIIAQKTKAPDTVLSLLSMYDGKSEDEMNLRIFSFTGTNTIAEKFGFLVGDYLFASYMNPVCGTHEEMIWGEYESVVFYLKRGSRPSTFYAVRSRSASVSMLNLKSLPSSGEEDTLEEMDPWKNMEENMSDYEYHPIRITEPGELGIKAVKRKCFPDVNLIPYFWYAECDPYFDYSEKYSFQVESFFGTDSLARKFGIQAGDYLVLPGSEYTPAFYNYEQAFYIDTYDGVCEAIKYSTRPFTLYAIRLKSDYEMIEITVMDPGPLGIIAQKTDAPEEVLSLVDVFDGDSDGERNLRIFSFTGTNTIAEKFGLQVGDYLFVSYMNPVCGSNEELICGGYKSVAYCIRRNPRPTTFYVVRSKSKSVTLLNLKALSSVKKYSSLEDLDPMKNMKKNSSDYEYHPIRITESGQLGIKAVKRKSLPKGSDLIPYFWEKEVDSYIDDNCEYSFQVESLLGTDSLARKFGIQAGDYLVLPSSEYTPAFYNYEEAFYIDTYDGVCEAIKERTRPFTLYAIRLKSNGISVESIAIVGNESDSILGDKEMAFLNVKPKASETVIFSGTKSGKKNTMLNNGAAEPLDSTASLKPTSLPGDEKLLDESSNFKLIEIVVADHGSMGIMARKTKAPDEVSTMSHVGRSCKNFLRIDSFIEPSSIAEKAGMQVGDFLFISRLLPDGIYQDFRKMVFCEYGEVAYYIWRNPRPTTFYVARPKFNIFPSISSDSSIESLEDMDPMNDKNGEYSFCTFSYHPITLTEFGPLGIVAKRIKNLPDGYDEIPYFFEEECDDASSSFSSRGYDDEEDSQGYFQVKSMTERDGLAFKFGIRAGDYLVRPSSNYTPAAFNYQEAFFVAASFNDICTAIRLGDRPLILYAIRSEPNCVIPNMKDKVPLPTTKTIKQSTTTMKPRSRTGHAEGLDFQTCNSSIQESSDYELHKIAVTDDGSIGIMARRTKASKAVIELLDLFDGNSESEMNLCIDSIIRTGSIAEKFGMQVGDFLFLSCMYPVAPGEHKEIIFGEYQSVSYCIRRRPRPTTFYVVRSKSNIIPSTSLNSSRLFSLDGGNESKSTSSKFVSELVEDLNPGKFMNTDRLFITQSYFPIIVTEPGPLGITLAKKQIIRGQQSKIPFFSPVDIPRAKVDYRSFLKVQSMTDKNCLACNAGIKVGDFLVLASSDYTPAKFNNQEAFYVQSYDVVLEAIKKQDRPLTLYAIRRVREKSNYEKFSNGRLGSMDDIKFHRNQLPLFL